MQAQGGAGAGGAAAGAQEAEARLHRPPEAHSAGHFQGDPAHLSPFTFHLARFHLSFTLHLAP